MPDSRQVRDARPIEFAAASQIIRAAYAEYESVYPPEKWPTMLNRFGDVWARSTDSELIVCVVADRVVGAASFYPDGSASEQGVWPAGWAGLLRLGVDPKVRRSGVARALVDECIARCGKRGIKTLALHSANWMPVARAMYERMGFVADPSFDFHPAPGTVGMGFRLEIV
jgi:GNAT superfamily N-acetyltransferase